MRNFTHFTDAETLSSGGTVEHKTPGTDNTVTERLSYLRNSIIGNDEEYLSPFEVNRRILHCDWTASGKACKIIENVLNNDVYPFYSNTHTSSSMTGIQSSIFRKEARNYIFHCVNGSKDDILLFDGSGSTKLINKFCQLLKLKERNKNKNKNKNKKNNRVSVLIGPFEHHSNILTWIEHGCDVITLNSCENSDNIDLVDFENTLKYIVNNDKNDLCIVSLSRCSNVTGIMEDDISIGNIIGKYQRICAKKESNFEILQCWDYSTCAPYIEIDMNPILCDSNKDCIFLSCHKFLGGINTPGLCVIKKRLLLSRSNANRNGNGNAPPEVGGGTVFYVSPDNNATYFENFEEKYEAGTQDIIGSIRAGLTFRLKHEFIENNDIKNILKIEQCYLSLFYKKIQPYIDNNQIQILGKFDNNNKNNNNKERLPIFSFLIKVLCKDNENGARMNKNKHNTIEDRSIFSVGNKGLYLHYNFVCTLLSDLFGIQSRGGCMCAGPYSHKLLGIAHPIFYNKILNDVLIKKYEIFRPGYTRINLHYTLTISQVNFIIDCIIFLIKYGYKFLPFYGYFIDTGEFRHKKHFKKMIDRRSLANIDLIKCDKDSNNKKQANNDKDSSVNVNFQEYLDFAYKLLEKIDNGEYTIVNNSTIIDDPILYDVKYKDICKYRWFILPSQVKSDNLNNEMNFEIENLDEIFQEMIEMEKETSLQRLLKERKKTCLQQDEVDTFEAKTKTNEDYLVHQNENENENKAEKWFELEQEEEEQEEQQRPINTMHELMMLFLFINIGFFLFINNPSNSNDKDGNNLVSQVSKLILFILFVHLSPRYLKNVRLFGQEKENNDEDVSVSSSTSSSENGLDFDQTSRFGGGIGKGKNKMEKGKETEKKDDRTEYECINCYHFHFKFMKECLHCQCIDYKPAIESIDTTDESKGIVLDDDNKKQQKNVSNKKDKSKEKLSKKLCNLVGRAIRDYNMINDGDNVLIAISGGKDSMTMLNILLLLQKKAPINFKIGVCNVDPNHKEYNPKYLKNYISNLKQWYVDVDDDENNKRKTLHNIEFYGESQPIYELSQKHMDSKKVSFCSFCSRMKRGILYNVCLKNNYNVLSIGQHCDDICESFIMSSFYNGKLNTMKANYHCKDYNQSIRIIRPLLYVREYMTRNYSKINNLPIVNENCPACYQSPQERQRIKLMLASQEQLNKNLFSNILSAIKPLIEKENDYYSGK